MARSGLAGPFPSPSLAGQRAARPAHPEDCAAAVAPPPPVRHSPPGFPSVPGQSEPSESETILYFLLPADMRERQGEEEAIVVTFER